MGRLELGEGCVWPCKNDQVAQGSLLCSRHPHTGIMGFGGKGLIANLHEARGLQHGKGLQCGVMLGIIEGNHKAGPCDQLWPSWPGGCDLSIRGRRRWDMGSMCLLRGLRHLGGLGRCSRGTGSGRDSRRGCRRWHGLGLHLALFFQARGSGHSTIWRGFSHNSISNLGRRGTRGGRDDDWGVVNPDGFRGRTIIQQI